MSTTVKFTFDPGERSLDDLEAEIRETVENATGDPPRSTSQYAGCIVLWPDGVPDVDQLAGIDAPRVVETRYNDTVDAGDGTLYQRVAGEFVAVDAISSPELDLGNYVLDYFRINYGIAPHYRYSKPEDPGTSARPDGRPAWEDLLSPEVFAPPDMPDEATALGRLEDDDPAERARAVRYLAVEGTDDQGHYERFLRSLATVDERTRALVASALWDPAPLDRNTEVDASLFEALLTLVDDPVPEVRIGAFMGASRAFEALYNGTDGPLDADTCTSFYEAHVDLLGDEDPRVRERTVRCLEETLGSRGAHLFIDPLWRQVEFDLRWRLARAVERNTHDDDLGSLGVPTVTTEAFYGDPSAVETLVEYVYEERGPTHEAVRVALAEFAEDRPADALAALEPAIEAVDSGTPLVADVRLLAALARERPDRVAAVADELAALLEAPAREADEADRRDGYTRYVDQRDPEELRDVAARALNRLPADAHPVEQSRLAAVTGSITRDEHGRERLVPARAATLAELDPETAAEKLGALPAETHTDGNADEGFRRSSVEETVHTVSTANPEAVAQALPDLRPLIEAAPDAGEDLAVALARTAVAHPEAVDEHAEAIGTWLCHHDPIVREAAATALVTLDGERDRVPEPYEPLLDRAGDALDVETLETVRDLDDRSRETPPEWPAGLLVASPSTLVEGVVACLDDDFWQAEQLADLLREVRAGDAAVAGELLSALLRRRRAAVTTSKYRKGVLDRLTDTDPALVVGAVDAVAEALADPEFETRRHPDRDGSRPTPAARSLEEALLTVARADPAAAEAAITDSFASVEAFRADHETDRRREIAQELGGEGPRPRADAGTTGRDPEGVTDPCYAFSPGEYGTDLIVDADDVSAVPDTEDVAVVRCRVTEADVLRRVEDDSFVRRVVGPEEPVGTVPDDADGEMVSLLTQVAVPGAFVRLADPDGRNVLTRVMDLGYDIDRIELFRRLCQSVDAGHDRRDVERIEEQLDQLGAIEEVDGAETLVREHLL